RATVAENPRYVVRFGSRMATMLLLLELGAHRQLDGFDAEWFEAEFLYRLRQRLADFDGFDPSTFDWHCHQFQYESIDLDLLIEIGKRKYRKVLLEVLRALYDEEGLGSEITEAVRRVLRLSRF
ncbi:MAG TPA: hypothetical protein VEU30_14860, partial [Thermoanaerobaculia bacterium]|nr:hypothetical protein [Thermoanaerobaculia bacterium]